MQSSYASQPSPDESFSVFSAKLQAGVRSSFSLFAQHSSTLDQVTLVHNVPKPSLKAQTLLSRHIKIGITFCLTMLDWDQHSYWIFLTKKH